MSLPFDFVKTRMQKMSALPDGTMPYKSSLDCAMKVCRSNAALLCVGFPLQCVTNVEGLVFPGVYKTRAVCRVWLVDIEKCLKGVMCL